MERAKLKLTVIVLLAILNLCLLTNVIIRHVQAQLYENEGRTQAMVYLERNGIAAGEESIPWESALLGPNQNLEALLLPGSETPPLETAELWEVQPMRGPETLLVDFVQGLAELGTGCTEMQAITEGYICTSEGDRAVFTPQWEITTDTGTYRLDCASGDLTKQP